MHVHIVTGTVEVVLCSLSAVSYVMDGSLVVWGGVMVYIVPQLQGPAPAASGL